MNSTIPKQIAQEIANSAKIRNIKPFCQKFWETVDFKYYQKLCKSGVVTYHGDLNTINHHLTNPGISPGELKKTVYFTGVTPAEMIELTDAEFKALPKTTETIISYRGIMKKPEHCTSSYKRFMKSLDVKEGDIVYMPEYAYSTTDINYAKHYLYGESGIMYEIEIPSGSRVSKGSCEIVFPRSSRFECLGKEEKDGITTIKLKYIQPIDYIG